MIGSLTGEVRERRAECGKETVVHQSLIDILGRLGEFTLNYNGPSYADDPEYDLSDEDKAKINDAKLKALKDLPA
jgi:hypothetical protein